VDIDKTNESSIPIHERVELPENLIPADSRVEIDAKITAGALQLNGIWAQNSCDHVIGYFTAGKRMNEEELKAVQGRMWDE
jgi:hypothetical protein